MKKKKQSTTVKKSPGRGDVSQILLTELFHQKVEEIFTTTLNIDRTASLIFIPFVHLAQGEKREYSKSFIIYIGK